MSSSDALASVTATLMALLSPVITGQSEPGITAKSPSIARKDRVDKQINIFLYGVYYNTAFTNAPMPGTLRNGESAHPPLPLILKYLVTAYGDADEDISGQKLMGAAMSLLHDQPVLSRTDILNGESFVGDVESNLHEQIERIKITADVLTLDDMSKLWTSFQSAEYRLSTGYEVSVVLIESSRASRAPLPVIKRGEEDQGANVVAASSASLTGLRFAQLKPSAELGDQIILLGENLSIENTLLRFQHPELEASIDLVPDATQSTTEMALKLPSIDEDVELGSKWPAGFYALSLLTQNPDMPAWESNSISLPLSPRIESIDPVSTPAGNITLTLECMPQIKSEQRVALLFSDQIISPDSITTPADPTARSTLIFSIDNVSARATPYVLRLRVDGVDSIAVDFSGDTPQFADNQKVTIT